MAKILFIGAKDISAVRQPNHQDCPLGCDFRLEIKMLRSRLLHRNFSFISDVLSTKSLVFSPVLFCDFKKLVYLKRVLNILPNIEMHAIIETMMGIEWKLNIGIYFIFLYCPLQKFEDISTNPAGLRNIDAKSKIFFHVMQGLSCLLE